MALLLWIWPPPRRPYHSEQQHPATLSSVTPPSTTLHRSRRRNFPMCYASPQKHGEPGCLLAITFHTHSLWGFGGKHIESSVLLGPASGASPTLTSLSSPTSYMWVLGKVSQQSPTFSLVCRAAPRGLGDDECVKYYRVAPGLAGSV